MKEKISIVVPMYNEEEVANEFYTRTTTVLKELPYDYELIIVNDGSRDKTLEIVLGFVDKDAHVKVINFSRNFGHQAAITAGIENAEGDAIITIDADLQDPPEVMVEMIAEWQKGFDIVYAKRKSRKTDTFFKRFTANMYYKILNKLSDIKTPENVGDFRLISKRVQEVFKKLPEKDRYIRGMFAWMGFKQSIVEFDRQSRFAGETKYPLKKMLKLAFSGIIGFSTKPLQLIIKLGLLTTFVSFVLLIYAIVVKVLGYTTSGWASLMVAITFIGGIQLLSLGIVAEYIGKIYGEVKDRPVYIIMDKYSRENTKQSPKMIEKIKNIFK